MKLPDVTDVGTRLPNAVRGQPSYPTSNPAANALQGFGSTLASVGFNAAEKANNEADKTRALGVQSRFLQFEDEWSKASVDRAEMVTPGAAGFTESLKKDYAAAARAFINTMPDEDRPVYDQRLFDLESRLTNGASKFEREEKDRYAKGQIEDGQGVLLSRQASDPAKWQDVEREGEELIRSRPGASPVEADDEVRKWRKKRAAALFATRTALDENEKYKLGAGLAASASGPVSGANLVAAVRQVESSGDPNAESGKGASGSMQVMPATGREIARELDDRNFPMGGSDEQVKAYLKSPGVSERYGEHYLDKMLRRYNGDAEAALVAYNGGPARGDAWVKSGRDDSVLPSETSAYYKKVLDAAGRRGSARPSGPDLPIVTQTQAGRVSAPDLSGVKPEALALFKRTQNAFGSSIPVVSGFRDPKRNAAAGGAKHSQHMSGEALDLDVSGMPNAERVRLIQTASAQGFTGIGVYGNSIHLDTGPRRSWGPSHHGDSVPDWAKAAINEHLAGTAKPVGNAGGGADTSILTDPAPEYAALSYEDRLGMFEKSLADERNRRKELSVEAQGQIETTIANAPSAIQNTGSYSGEVPSLDKFVLAYGPDDGVKKFDAFNASMEVSQQAYDFRAMSTADINQAVQEAVPVSSGNDAALQADKFRVLQGAAEATIKARNADPAAYTQQVFPSVAQAWQQVQTATDNESRMAATQSAMSQTAAAQRQLGITDMRLLPESVADQAQARFKDENVPEQDRIAAIAGIVFSTNDPEQQNAVFEQLVKAGLPEITEGALRAATRGDTGAAQELFKAAMVDVSKLPGKNPDEATPAKIDAEIRSQLMDVNQIGDVFYGLSSGAAENFVSAQRDAKLMTNAVTLRVRKGESLDAAITGVARALYGDVKPISNANVSILIPSDKDERVVASGLDAMQPKVRQALEQTLTVPDAVGADKALAQAQRQNMVQTYMLNGVWRNAGAGFAYLVPDPKLDTFVAVAGPDGKPLIFSEQDVLAAGSVPRETRVKNGAVDPSQPLTDDAFTNFQNRMGAPQ